VTPHNEFRSAVVVVGGSRGIGRAIAKVAARDRNVVVLIARSPEGLTAAAADVQQAGGEAFTLELDLLAADASERLEAFLTANDLVCGVLVNSAGYGLRGAATLLPLNDQLGIVDLNIRALTDLTLRFLPGMLARGRGGVINLVYGVVLRKQGFRALFFGRAPSGSAPLWRYGDMCRARTGVHRIPRKGRREPGGSLQDIAQAGR
jgi:short-subunit dehydrogenase